MKMIKIFDSFKSEEDIKYIAYEYGIYKHQILEDGSINVYNDVYLSKNLKNLKQLPLTFNEVTYDFDCSNNNLTTLEGCPKKVGWIFNCSLNKLTSLEYSPEIVEGNFNCYYNDYLTSLEGLENTYIDGYLDILCSEIYSLKGFPKRVSAFFCKRTPIEPIYNTFIQECDYETMRRFNKFDVIYTDGLDWFIDYDNLGKFLRSVGKEDLMMSKEDFDDFINTTYYRWDY
jgi:hypothetical protein